MPDIRIVCTHDAVKTIAADLMRRLSAEQHVVRLTYGRPSLTEIDDASKAKDAVIVIWSYDAPGAHYMHEWARRIAPAHLIEIASAPVDTRSDRRMPVVDFTTWRGERGGRAWNALTERLRTIARTLDPHKPPPYRAALALGAASFAAISGAVVLRLNDTAGPEQAQSRHYPAIAAYDAAADGVGGALRQIEPGTEEFERIVAGPFGPSIEAAPIEPLAQVRAYEAPELRDPTLMERLSALNPIGDNERE